MSVFKTISSSQDVAVILFENESTTNKLDMNVNTVSVTNLGATSVVIDLHIHPNVGNSHTIANVNMPAGVTFVYDTPFSFPFDSRLRITPNNNNELNVTIN